MTLRRDLEYFETAGEAVRIRGGIRYIKSLPGAGREDLYEQRLAQNQEAKNRIAWMCIRLYQRRAVDFSGFRDNIDGACQKACRISTSQSSRARRISRWRFQSGMRRLSI